MITDNINVEENVQNKPNYNEEPNINPNPKHEEEQDQNSEILIRLEELRCLSSQFRGGTI